MMSIYRQSANHHLMRDINRALILNHLRLAAPQSRAELAERTGLTRSTVSSLVDELIADNLVHETGVAPSRGGRRGTLLALNPAGGCAVGVAITSDAITVLLTDFVAHPRWQRQVTLEDTDPAQVMGQVEALIDEALAYNAAHEVIPLLGIGLATPGLVRVRDGTLRTATNLGWHDIPFQTRWEARYGVPVRVGNEASIAALGEHYFGAGAGFHDFIYLELSTRAIGAGIFVAGRLYQGVDGYAGEVGHMVVDPAGAVCSCGRRGCWEAVLRQVADLMPLREALAVGTPSSLGDPARLTRAAVLNAAAAGDALARDYVQRLLDVLVTGLANLVNVFNPQRVVLGGSLGLLLAPFLPALQSALAARVTLPAESVPELVLAQIATNPSALGAVALVLDEIMSEPVPVVSRQSWP
ncbi:MAG: transcriptional regulator [Anaerolineae bacterium]|nr:MAG: transcriptional regulator [Anaerolineae bacterium]